MWGLDHRSRSRSRRSQYILPGAGAGAGAAEQFYSEPEPEPEPECCPGAGAGAGADQKCHGSASLIRRLPPLRPGPLLLLRGTGTLQVQPVRCGEPLRYPVLWPLHGILPPAVLGRVAGVQRQQDPHRLHAVRRQQGGLRALLRAGQRVQPVTSAVAARSAAP